MDRLLERHIKSIDREIAALKWLDNQVISEALLVKLISKVGLNKLKSRDLLSNYGINGLKIHDLILNCITLKSSSKDYSTHFESQFIIFFKEHLTKKDYFYFRTLHLHKEKLFYLLLKNPREFALIYASVEHLELSDLFITLEKIHIHELLDSVYTFKQEDYYQILAFIECIENIHRFTKWENIKEGVLFAEKQMPYMKKLMEINGLSEEIKFELMHHLGKFYVFVKKFEIAEECFRQVIENNPHAFHSKLQLLKIIFATKNEEAKGLLRDILNSFKENRQQVSISIVLAAFNELKKTEFNEITEEYLFNGTLFEEAISISSIWGFTQPYQVITEIGKTIAYHDPNRFIKIMEMIPEPSEESTSDFMLFYSGQLYKVLGKCYRQVEGDDSQKCRSVFELSKMFYDKMSTPNSYHLTQICELYQLLGLPELAINTLEKVPIENRKNSFWHYRYSLSLYEQYQFGPALLKVENALKLIKKSEERFRATFLYHKAQVLTALDDKAKALAVYHEAYKLSENEKFRSSIEAAINNLSTIDAN
ncbi:hypothetical protein H6F38_24375 [Paenibacillus sp. EKM208P]|nr:hypothetical protein H6F38_24375 [Paenibacillus sp. EKM208P]